jgi:YD repeat-containing protein
VILFEKSIFLGITERSSGCQGKGDRLALPSGRNTGQVWVRSHFPQCRDLTRFTTPNTITQTQIDLAASNPASTSRTWTSVLDRLDRVVTSISPDPVTGLTTTASDQRIGGGFVTSTAYDNLSNVLKVTNGLNQVTSFTYDDLNRITKISTPSATSGPAVDTQFAYSTYAYGPMRWGA